MARASSAYRGGARESQASQDSRRVNEEPAEELFDSNGKLDADLAALPPKGQRRMGMNPHANGGLLLEPLHLSVRSATTL